MRNSSCDYKAMDTMKAAERLCEVIIAIATLSASIAKPMTNMRLIANLTTPPITV